MIRKAIFDAAVSGQLTETFTRDIATLDAAGSAVGVNTPRYAPATLLATSPAWTVAYTTAQRQVYLGSGYAANGDALAAFVDAASKDLRIFKGSLSSPVSTRNLVRGSTTDLLQGLGNQVADVTYKADGGCGLIAHGLMLALCPRAHWTGSAWEERGISLLMSNDDGAAWSIVDDPTGVTGSTGLARVLAEWPMSNYYTRTRDGSAPLEIWVPWCDYLNNPGGVGGQAFLTRFTRASVGGTWTAGATRKMFEQSGASGMHVHSAGVVFHGTTLHFIVALGDGTALNEVVRVTCDADTYDVATLTTQREFHGSTTTIGNQFAGCAPGPTYDTIICSADNNQDDLTLLAVPSGLSDKATFSHLHGTGLAIRGATNTFEGLWVICDKPENGGPYLARLKPSGTPPTDSMRVTYSTDGLTWGIIARHVSSYSRSLPCFFGDDILLTCGTTDSGLRTIPRPTAVSRQPIQVAPGGTNRLAVLTYTGGIGSGNTNTVLTKNGSGLWQLPDNTVISPQPPAHGPMYLCESGATSAAMGLHRLNLTMPVGKVYARFWVKALETQSAGCNPRVFLYLGSSTQGEWADTNRVIATDEWIPLVVQHDFAQGAAYDLRISLQSGSTATTSKFLFCADTVLIAPASYSYPMPVTTTGAHELLSVGVTTGTEWTLGIAGRLPHDSWDTSISAHLATVPLWTAYQDANNYLHVTADLANHQIKCAIVAGGSTVETLTTTVTYMRRGDPIKVALSRMSNGTYGLAAQVGGSGTLVDAASTATDAIAPVSLRFSNADQTSVASQEVFSVLTDDTNGYDSTDRAALIRGGAMLHGSILAIGRGVGGVFSIGTAGVNFG